jgi:hypothetical protein
MSETLNYKTHRAYDPLYHFFVLPVLGINVLVAAYFLYRRPVLLNVWAVIFGLALVALAWRVRFFPLLLQDRIIRLEETLRLERVLPDDLRAGIGGLSTGDLIALRFCTDEELPEHVRAIYAGEYKGRESIKSRIKTWRPDTHRI